MARILLLLKFGAFIICLIVPLSVLAQSAAISDPITVLQNRNFNDAVQDPGRRLATALPKASIGHTEILDYAEKTFPKLADELDNAELLRKAIEDPRSRGNLRGRIAEEDWIKRNNSKGWVHASNPIDPQYDAVRRVDGKIVETAQHKAHQNWRNYLGSMAKDDKATHFIIPDDHYELVYNELETRRLGALRGRDEALRAGLIDKADGLAAKADDYARQQVRLTKMGRTFQEIDNAIGQAATHYGRIARVMRASGNIVSFVAVVAAITEGRIAIHDLATGEAEVTEVVGRVTSATVTSAASRVAFSMAAKAAMSAGATGHVPVAVAIVVAAGTYFVVDWGIREVADCVAVAYLSPEDVARIFPEGLRGVSLTGLDGGVPLDGLGGGVSLEGLGGGVSLEGLGGGVSLEGD